MCIGVDAKNLADRPVKVPRCLKVAGGSEVAQAQSLADSLLLLRRGVHMGGLHEGNLTKDALQDWLDDQPASARRRKFFGIRTGYDGCLSNWISAAAGPFHRRRAAGYTSETTGEVPSGFAVSASTLETTTTSITSPAGRGNR